MGPTVCSVNIVYDVAGVTNYVVTIIVDNYRARKYTFVSTTLNINIAFLWVMLGGYGLWEENDDFHIQSISFCTYR